MKGGEVGEGKILREEAKGRGERSKAVQLEGRHCNSHVGGPLAQV